MKRIIACLIVIGLCGGCSSVSKVSSGAWRKTKSLFGAGDETPQGKKITVENYPSRTTISTLDQPKMEVKTRAQKVDVQPRIQSDAALTTPTAPEEEVDRRNLSPEERRLQEKIDRTVEELQRKHKSRSIFGIFR